MSSTSRASKRQRLARRAENDTMRTARRDSLAVLLSRAERGRPISPDEAALLRVAVEAEMRESDAARTSERGQQRAMEQQRQRVEAAEAAIVEAEQRAERAEHQIGILHAIDEGRAHGARRIMDERNEWQQRAAQAEAALDRVRALAADMRTWCSPHGIATQYADDIERALNGQQDQAVTVSPGVAVVHDRTAERKLSESETLGHRLLQRAERAEQDRATLATELQAVRARAQEAEEQSATQRNRARMWRQKAIETDDRADRFEAAWHSARARARKRTAQRDRAEQALDRARIVGPQLEYDATAPGIAEAAREAFRDSSRRIRDALATPEVITDRATIRNTLAEPEPAECEVPWHVHVETRPGPECHRNDRHDAHDWKKYGEPRHCPGYDPRCTCDDCAAKTAATETAEEPTR